MRNAMTDASGRERPPPRVRLPIAFDADALLAEARALTTAGTDRASEARTFVCREAAATAIVNGGVDWEEG